MSTKQSKLWEGEFGYEYHNRNDITEPELIARMNLWRSILQMANPTKLPESFLEVGAGLGINLKALKQIFENSLIEKPNLVGNEINQFALNSLKFAGYGTIPGDFMDVVAPLKFDMVYTSGVLIHVPQETLVPFMRKMYDASNRFIVCIEYFSPERREIKYRGNDEALWTDRYGDIWMEKFNLRCIGYGFCWKRITQLDNLTWWLFEKVH